MSFSSMEAGLEDDGISEHSYTNERFPFLEIEKTLMRKRARLYNQFFTLLLQGFSNIDCVQKTVGNELQDRY